MNYARDYANNIDLQLAGWRVIRIWECEIRTKARREEILSRLYAQITQPHDNKRSYNGNLDPPAAAAEPETSYGD